MTSNFFDHNKSTLTNIFVILIIIIVAFIPGPEILGAWESAIYFHNFGSLEVPVDLRISLRGTFADPELLFPLGISRIISDFFNIFPTISRIRFVSIFYGLVALFLFFLILKRWFGILPSFITVLLLSVNPVFHMEQHSMTQLMISFMAFTLLFERLQYLELSKTSYLNWLGLSFAIFLVLLHYGPGRVFTVIFLFFWFAKNYLVIRNFPNSKFVINSIFLNLLSFVLIGIFFLVLIDWRNLFSIIKFYSLIIPADNETLFEKKEFFSNFLITIKINTIILFETLTSFSKNWHSIYSSNLLLNLRYPILNPILFFFFIGGLFISIKNIKKKISFLSLPYLSSIFLFLICFLPLFASTIINNEETTFATLSSNRMFYLILPTYIFVCIFIKFILDKILNLNKKIRFLIISYFIIFFFTGVQIILNENSRFSYHVNSNKIINKNITSNVLWSDDTWFDNTKYLKNQTYQKTDSIKYFNSHVNYHKYSKKIESIIKKNDLNYYILNIKTEQFDYVEDFFISKLNYVSVFLSFYLNNVGIENAWIQIIDSNKPNFSLGKRHKQRMYSAEVVSKDNNVLIYKDLVNYRAFLRYRGNDIPNVIIVTTKEELDFAVNYYKKNDIKSYSLLNI